MLSQSAKPHASREYSFTDFITSSYTVSKAMDDTPSLGSSSALVEQDPNNPGAEWALSNFDRRWMDMREFRRRNTTEAGGTCG